MTNDEIKELIFLVNETGIAELEVQKGDDRVRIRRNASSGSDQQVVLPAVLPLSVTSGFTQSSVQPGEVKAPEAPALPKPPTEDERNTLVKSPIVGTYYDSPSPGSAEYVKVGDRVHPKQVLCIIESMKLMNEIEAEVSGTILAKYVENGRPVEYGEALFSIGPA
jgi:acetyl-CoA carboxylase biotin carboxyl carrier protein